MVLNTHFLTGLITLLILGITPLRPVRGIISRVISAVMIGYEVPGTSKLRDRPPSFRRCRWAPAPQTSPV